MSFGIFVPVCILWCTAGGCITAGYLRSYITHNVWMAKPLFCSVSSNRYQSVNSHGISAYTWINSPGPGFVFEGLVMLTCVLVLVVLRIPWLMLLVVWVGAVVCISMSAVRVFDTWRARLKQWEADSEVLTVTMVCTALGDMSLTCNWSVCVNICRLPHSSRDSW